MTKITETIQVQLDQLAASLPEIKNSEQWEQLITELEDYTENAQHQQIMLKTVTDISKIASTVLEIEELLTASVNLIRNDFNFDAVDIYLVDKSSHWLELKASTNTTLLSNNDNQDEDAQNRVKIDDSSEIGWAVNHRQAHIFKTDPFNNDAENSPKMAIPLSSRGQLVGVIVIENTDQVPFTQQDAKHLQTLANQLANTVQNTLLLANSDRQLTQLVTLHNINLQIGSELNLKKLLGNIAQLSAKLVNADASIIRLLETDQQFKIYATYKSPNRIGTGKLGKIETGLSRKVIQARQAILINNWPQHPQAKNNADSQATQAVLIVPITIHHKVIGTIEAHSYSKQQAFDNNDLYSLSLLSSQTAIAIENTRLFGEAENNRHFLKTIIEQIPDPIFIKDRNHIWIEMNQANASVIGRPKEELIGKTDKMFFSSDLAKEFYRRDDEVFKHNKILQFEDSTVWGDEQEHTAYTRLIPLAGASGEPEHLLGITHDITERKVHEAERERFLEETAALYNGSREISQALSDRQVYNALFGEIRRQDPCEIAVFRLNFVGDEPLWAQIRAGWQKRNNPTYSIGTTFNLIDHPLVRLLTTDKPLFIEDVASDSRLSKTEREGLAPSAARSVAVLPLSFTGHIIGPVIVYFTVPYTFSEVTQRFWLALADQAGVALSNRQLIQEAAYRAIQMETAAEVARSASTLLGLKELLNSAVALIRDRFQLYYVGAFLLDEEEEWAELRSGTGTAGQVQIDSKHRLEVGGESMIGWCIQHRQPRIALDVGQDAVHFQNPHLPETRSEMALPLIYHNKAIGALTIQSNEQAAFSKEDIVFLQTMADQLANAIENARLYEQAQLEIAERTRAEKEILRRNEELAEINRITSSISSILDLDAILQTTAKEMVAVFNARNCGIALINDDRTELTVVADHSSSKDEPSAKGAVIPLADNPASLKVIETGEPIIVPQAQTNPITKSIHGLLKERNTHSIMILPQQVRGEVIGTVGIDTTDPDRTFTDDELQLAGTIVGQVAVAIENARLFEQTQTALAERERAQEVLAQRERYLAAQLDIQDRLLGTKGHDAPYETILQILGEVSGASRVYVFENHQNSEKQLLSSQRAEWRVEGIESEIDNPNLQNVNLKEQLPKWEKALQGGKAFSGKLANFPKKEKTFLKARNVKAILVLPLMVSDEFFGFVGFDNCIAEQPWEASEEGLLSAAAAAVSLWHERRRAEEGLLLALQRTESLYRIGDAMATATDQQNTFETVLAEYLRLLNLKPAYGSIIMFEHNKGYSKVQALHLDGRAVDAKLSFPVGQDLVGKYLIQHKTPLVIEDIHTHHLTKNSAKLWQQDESVKSLLFIPLVVRGIVVGAISIGSTERRYVFSQGNIEIGQVVTDQLAIWLENRQLLVEAQYRSERLQTASEVSKAASSILDTSDLIDSSVNLIRNRFGFYYVGLFLIDETKEWAVLKAGTGEAGRIQLERNHKLKIGGESMIGWSVENRKARIALDVGEEAVRFQNPILPDTHSEMALPLISRDEVIGALTVQSIERDAFSDEDITMLQTMADQIANALANANLFESVAKAQKQAEGRLRETLALQTLSQNLAATLKISDILNIFFGACTREIGFEYVMFSMVDKQQNRIKAIDGTGLAESNIHRANHSLDSKDIMADIIRTGNTETIVGWDDRFDRETFEAEGHANWVRTFTPIALRNENIGVVEAGFQKNVQSDITEAQIRLLKAFITQTALAIDNAQRYQASQRAAHREALIKEITTKVRSSTNLDTILQTTVKEVGNAIDSKKAYIHLATPKKTNGNALLKPKPDASTNGKPKAAQKREAGNE